MAKLSAQTVSRLRWLKSQLLKHPHRYDQRNWCGTEACLAGFCLPKAVGSRKVTLEYSDPKLEWAALQITYRELAANWLGIDRVQSMKLFSSFWGGDAHQYMRTSRDTDVQAARKARRRIDMFIKTEGRD